jgi:hypothetical protein
MRGVHEKPPPKPAHISGQSRGQCDESENVVLPK